MGKRYRTPVVAIAAVASWLAVSGAFASVLAATTFGPGVDCPPAHVSLQTLISMHGERGPLSLRYEAFLNERALHCLGGTELTFVAFQGAPEGLGGAVSYRVKPGWLDTWNEPRSFLAVDSTELSPGFVTGPFLAVAVPPGLQDQFDGLRGRWVSVQGHFDDPAAGTCRLSDDPSSDLGRIPTNADLIDMCRTSFVVTGIESTASPCPAGAIDWATISATPEHLRADCFGDRKLTFVARGVSVATAWPLVLPAVTDWELLDPAGGNDVMVERAKALDVFVPVTTAVPNPTDAPWHDTDGVGGFDVLWRIQGHFDDPRAADCRPNADGATVDGQVQTWSEEDALGFCRNHLFVDSLEWISPAATAGSQSASSATAEPSGASPLPPTPTSMSSVSATLAGADRASSVDGAGLVVAAVLGSAALGLILGGVAIRRRRS